MVRDVIEIIHEVNTETSENWNLCFQWVRYHYADKSDSKMGYRFIWRRPDGSIQRGNSRIPSASHIFLLLKLATEDGWFIVAESNNT